MESVEQKKAPCPTRQLTSNPAKKKGPGRPRKYPDDHHRYLQKGSRSSGRPRVSRNMSASARASKADGEVQMLEDSEIVLPNPEPLTQSVVDNGAKIDNAEVSDLQFPLKCPHCSSSQISYLTQASYEAHCILSHIGNTTWFKTQKEEKVSKESFDGQVQLLGTAENVLPISEPPIESIKDDGARISVSEVSQQQFSTKCPHCPSSQISYLTQASYEAHCLVSHLGDDQCLQTQEGGGEKDPKESGQADYSEDDLKGKEVLIEHFKEFLASNENPLAYLVNEAKKGNCSILEGAIHRFLTFFCTIDINKDASNDSDNNIEDSEKQMRDVKKCASSIKNWIFEHSHGELNLELDKLCNGLKQDCTSAEPCEKYIEVHGDTGDVPESELGMLEIKNVLPNPESLTHSDEKDGHWDVEPSKSELQFPTRCSTCPSSQTLYHTQASYDTHCLVSHEGGDDDNNSKFQNEDGCKEGTNIEEIELHETTKKKRELLFEEFNAFLESNENSLSFLINEAKIGNSSPLEGAIHRFLKELWVGHIKRDSQGNIPPSEYRYMLKQSAIRSYRSTLKNLVYQYTDGKVNLELNKLFPGLMGRGFKECPKWVLLGETRSGEAQVPQLQFPTKCPHCPSSQMTYLSESSFEAHCLVSHPFKCSLCSKRSSCPSNMQRHFLRYHPEHRPHICSSCALVFVSPDMLKNHKCQESLLQGAAASLKAMREEGKPWVRSLCSFCPSSKELYETSSLYETHCLETHPYQCPVCPRMYDQPGKIRNHFRSVHNTVKPYLCYKCPLVFLDCEALKSHNCTKSLWKRSEKNEERPWWDGCLVKCKHCGDNFPEEVDVQRHIFIEHTSPSQLKRHKINDRKEGKGSRRGTLNKDYEILRTTYWDCELCGDKKKGKTLKRQYTTIRQHVKNAHNAQSLAEYQAMVKKSSHATSPKEDVSKEVIPDRNLRSFAKGRHKNFREIANGKWECKICRKYYNDSSRHLSQCHDMTLAEYEHTAGVTTYMNQFAQEVEETVVQVMDIDMEEAAVQEESETGTEQVQETVPELYAPVTEEVKAQVNEEVQERNMGNINEASSANEHELGTEPISHNAEEPVSEEIKDPVSCPQPVEERKDFVALPMSLPTFGSTHEETQGAFNSDQGTWECKICKKRLKFAPPQSHVLHYHKMTYAKYIRDFVKQDTDRTFRGETEPVPHQHPSYIDMVKEAITAVRARNKVWVFSAQFIAFLF